MRALRIVGEKQVIVRDSPEPRPGQGEVLVAIKASGVCGSDLHPYRHPRTLDDYIPGHEPAGVISELGPGVVGWEIGDRVVVYFRRTCSRCYYCLIGHRNLCLNRRSSYGHVPGADGSDAELMVAETSSLMRLPDDLTFADGSILACQAGTAYYPLAKMNVSGRDTLVVSGLGPVGLLATLFGRAMGASIVGIDPSADRRALASRIGAEITLDPTAGPIGEQLLATHPLGADKLIETSGSNAAHAVIADLLKPLGFASIVGLGSEEFRMPLMRLVHRQITVFGTSIYPDTMFEEICDFVRRRKVDLSSVVGHTFSLEEGPEAFRIADSATAGKVMFRVG